MDQNLEEILNTNPSNLFRWPEYVVFISVLGISAGIGVFYGCFGGKQKTTQEYLMADKKMSVFPMSMSVIASFISAITLLGTPVEMYNYGTQYYLVVINFFFVTIASAHLYLPVFHRLQVTSTFEYLEKRFSKTARLLGSSVFIFQMVIYMAICVLAPALALEQVTGIPTNLAVAAIFVVVIFYTTLGGMKAVMWTDCFQVIIMFGAMLIVTIKGTVDAGGISQVWSKAEEGGRIEFFNFDPDPRVRHTVWGLLIGGYFIWTSIYGTNQAQVQRYLCVPTLRKAKLAIWINFIGLVTMVTICSFAGLVIYSRYSGCHPLYAGRVKKSDQLFPLFVMDTLAEFQGLPGLFVAGIFSGALSTVSSGLNSLSAITLEDFFKGHFTPNINDARATNLSKVFTVVYGLAAYGFVLIAEQLGGILEAAISIFGITGGPLLGLFTLGIFLPYANSRSAVFGTVLSLTFMFWIGFGAHFAKARGDLVTPGLSFGVHDCPANITITIPPPKYGKEGGILEFYRISYIWYSFIGCWLTIIFGLLGSTLTSNMKENARNLDPKFISWQVDWFVKKITSGSIREKVGWEIGKNLHLSADGIDNQAFQMEKNGFKMQMERVKNGVH